MNNEIEKSSDVNEARRHRLLSPPVRETFSDDLPQGRVVGSVAPGGFVRGGCDAERQIGIDHGALRFRPLITPGWGREGIAYGPFRREPGLTLAVSITNGHNASQGIAMPEGFLKRVARWAVGTRADPPLERVFEWLRGRRKRGTLRRLRWWAATRPKAYKGPEINENLAVGWFPDEIPGKLGWNGCYFMMHSAEGENAELWTRCGRRFLTAYRGVRNVRMYLVVTLRERGAVYYAAAVAGARGFGAFPRMRPVAIDPFNVQQVLFAGVHQSALGQIGWRADTLTHELKIERVPELGSRSGTAHAADALTGLGSLDEGPAGLTWHVRRGPIARTEAGAAIGADGAWALAATDPGEPSGLIHALIASPSATGCAGLAWRVRDAQNFCLLRLSANGSALVRVAEGVETLMAEDRQRHLIEGAIHSVQILNVEGLAGCYLDGVRLFDKWLDDADLCDGACVGIWFGSDGRGVTIRDFEAHPREVAMPASLDFHPSWSRLGSDLVLADDFRGSAGDLAGRRPEDGTGAWMRSVGRGSFNVTGDGALLIQGSAEEPHPGRTFYTLPWERPEFADLEVTVTPPGSRQGEGQRTRAGLVFWQDRRNYLSISAWMNDAYPGASISVFPKRHGFEELYDAVWTNVGCTIYWRRPFRLRCSFNGDDFLILLDGEPIMQRALSNIYPDDPPLVIRGVGLAANWEWGTDTGSLLNTFRARA